MNTTKFIVRRLLQVLPVVLAIAAMNFLLLQLAPGDAADILAGQMGHASPELVEQMRRDFGSTGPSISSSSFISASSCPSISAHPTFSNDPLSN